MGKSRVCGISTGARCAPLQRGRNRNDEMRLQRWAASLQRLDAFATDGCIAVPRRGAHCAPVSYIAAPVTVITTMFREDARRVIGATAKPLYPIDGKAAGFDRRNPKTSLFEGGGPPQRWKEFVTQTVEGVHHALPKIQPLHFICFICFSCLVCPKHMMFSSKTIRCPSGECRDHRHIFFIESTYFEIRKRMKFQKNADL